MRALLSEVASKRRAARAGPPARPSRRRADGRGGAVADAVAARAAEPLVVLLDRPEAVQPVADVARLRNDRPVGVFHRVVGLDCEARGADRARVPAERRGLLGAPFVLG